jgi:UDP-N-acetylglucosamine 2-epimerase (non-hydrolysing)
VPCLTLRENTERPVTVTHGTNQIVGTDPARILAAWRQVTQGLRSAGPPPLWDGQAAVRIVDVLRSRANGPSAAMGALAGTTRSAAPRS